MRLQDVRAAADNFRCLQRTLRSFQCLRGGNVLLGNLSEVEECVERSKQPCFPGPGSSVAWNNGPPGAVQCAFLAFHHIDKAGGTTIREWMKQLELTEDAFEFLSSYSQRSCSAADRSLGIARCASMTTLRRVLHQSISAALRCEQQQPRFRLMSEYHAHDARDNLKAMAGSLPLWRSLAAPRGCKIVVAALVREPVRWYLSWVSYAAKTFKIQPKGDGSLEAAVQKNPNYQAKLIGLHWATRSPLDALKRMDVVAYHMLWLDPSMIVTLPPIASL